MVTVDANSTLSISDVLFDAEYTELDTTGSSSSLVLGGLMNSDVTPIEISEDSLNLVVDEITYPSGAIVLEESAHFSEALLEDDDSQFLVVENIPAVIEAEEITLVNCSF